MTNKYFLLSILILLPCTGFSQNRFYLNLNDRRSDLFTVTLIPAKLSPENSVYQFASTAPGTYSRMDIGRFVRSFRAFGKEGKEIEVKRLSVNQWSISTPESIDKITYEIDDTWDAPIDSSWIYPMCGSAVDSDYVVINGQCVFGYFHGRQSEPIEVKVEHPENWLLGTALPLNGDGFYEAENYDHIVDSPMLLGMLSKASAEISGADIDIYTYSKTNLLESEAIMGSVIDVLEAADEFTEGLPVDHYTFLFHFEGMTYGAWEHSYSSFYVFREDSLNRLEKQGFKDLVAHEFFHVVTPLNIHSELVEEFNFEKPVMSKHVWLYEGVTEWASHILLLRDSLISIEEYLYELRQKLNHMKSFNNSISLTYLSENASEMPGQYANIYNKGAVVAGLLDIRLLELSGGKKGLREVINQLAEEYGPDDPFDENTFFDDFTAITYPEIKDFIKKYIDGAENLPIKQYYAKLGIDYSEKGAADSSRVSLGIRLGFDNGKFIVANIDEDSPNHTFFNPGDILKKIEGEEITVENIEKTFAKIRSGKKPGDKLQVEVVRGNDSLGFTLTLTADKKENIFTVNPNPGPNQIALRNAWIKNLN